MGTLRRYSTILAAAKETIETMKLHLRQALMDQDSVRNELDQVRKEFDKAQAALERERAALAELRAEHAECNEGLNDRERIISKTAQNECEKLREKICILEGEKEHHGYMLESANESKEVALKELQDERTETGKRLDSHFSRIAELTQYGELLQGQLEAERQCTLDERERRRNADEKAHDAEERMAAMLKQQVAWEKENSVHASQVRTANSRISELIDEVGRLKVDRSKTEEIENTIREEHSQLENALQAERQLSRAAEKNIIALVEEKKDLVREVEKSHRRLHESSLVQPKMEEELLSQTRQIEHLKRNRDLVEDSLSSQLQHIRSSLDEVSFERTKLNDELVKQQRSNEKIRALLSLETLQKHQLMNS